MKKEYKYISIQVKRSNSHLKGLFYLVLILAIVADSCKKQPNNPIPVNLSAGLIAYKWQLTSATNYDSAGNKTSVYKGTPGDSLFFDWQPDSNFNVTATHVETFVGGNYATFGYTLKQIASASTDNNFIICTQPWKAGYSDTVRILPVSLMQQYIAFKIGKPYDSATEGYEIDSLSENGENDR